ncbi:MAG: hypothetical protein V1703_01530 [Candidatus Altiarchaeota archaeon]
MGKRLKHKLAIALVLTLALATGVGAGWLDKLMESVMEVIIPFIADLIFYPPMAGIMWMIKGLLYFNPTAFCYGQTGCKVTAGLDALYPYMMNILIPVYVIAIMFIALFFIVKSGSPAGRARARKMFFRLIMGMIMVIYSPFIYQAMLDISSTITSFYLDDFSVDQLMALMTFGKAAAMCYLLCCMMIIVLITAIILVIRWMFVYMYALFFPIILFMYFFEVTKPYGTKYLKDAARWIFTPAFQALILWMLVHGPIEALSAIRITGMNVLLQSLFSQLVGIFVVLGALIAVVAAPMIVNSIFDYVGTMVFSVGLAVDNLPLMSIGGVIAGQGPAAFTQAHGHFSRVRAYDSFVAGMMGADIAKEAPKAMRLVGSGRTTREGRGDQGTSPGVQTSGRSRVEEAVRGRRGTPSALPRDEFTEETSETPGEYTVTPTDETGASERGEEAISSEDLEAERAAYHAGGRTPSMQELAAAREEGEVETTGLSSKDLEAERGEVAGKEDLPFYRKAHRGIATPLTETPSMQARAKPKETAERAEGRAAVAGAAGAEGLGSMIERHVERVQFMKPGGEKTIDETTRITKITKASAEEEARRKGEAEERRKMGFEKKGEQKKVSGLEKDLKDRVETKDKDVPQKKQGDEGK